MKKHTTIIIVTYCINDIVIEATQKCFERCLKTINFYAPHTYEIMFVDNGSNDKFKVWLRSLQESQMHIKVVYLEGNPGFAKAANVGMDMASKFSDYVVLLNNDTLPRNGWLFAMVQVAASDDKIAVVGAKVIKPGTELVLHTGTILKDGEVIDPYSALTPNQLTPQKLVEERLWVNGCCMLIKSEIIRKFGLFNDVDFKMYFEEADYMVRLHQAGYRVVYSPMTEIEHYEKLTAKDIEGAKDNFYANWQKMVSKYQSYFRWQNNLDGCPKVAVIMPAYNAEGYIDKTINSVVKQTYSNFRLFIVDDASTDSTKEIINKYKEYDDAINSFINHKEKSKRIVSVFRDVNGGAAVARNDAIDAMNAMPQERFKYVFFIDADDVWDSNYLERMVMQLEQNPQVDMIYALCENRFEDGTVAIPYGIPDNITIFDKGLMLKQNYIHISFVGIRFNALNKIGKFFAELNGVEDWDYWSRVVKAGLNIQCYPDILGVYTVRKISNAGVVNEQKMKLLRERQR